MLVLNLLSVVLSWITRSYPLGTFATVLVIVFAVGNALLGANLAWRLVRS